MKTQKNIEAASLIDEDTRVVVGVSGGADSMALIDVLRRLMPGRVICAHMEHGIRGEESLRDAELVERYCLQYNIPFYMKNIDAVRIARERKQTLEQAARTERYAFFREVKRASNATRIAVAHHLDDQAETVIFNLVRGSGAKGLAAMEWMRADGIIRPFLNVSKEEIIRYCQQNSIEFAIDSTNCDTDYSRNLLRAEVMPQLKRLNPSASKAISRAAQLIGEDNDCLEELAERARAGKVQSTETELRIERDIITHNPSPIASRIIRQSLADWGVDKDIEQTHIRAIMELARTSPTGSQLDLPEFLIAVLSYNDIVFCHTPTRAQICTELAEGRYETITGEIEITHKSVGDEKEPDCEWLDRAKIPAGTVLRTRAVGDYIVPLGMKGKKKLKDYLSDKKIEGIKRDSLLLLAHNDQVFWVQGAGISENAKIDETTAQVLEIKSCEKK